MDILVFATNVEKAEEVNRIKTLLTAVGAIEDCNFDLEDCDKILRVEANNISPEYIESLLQNA